MHEALGPGLLESVYEHCLAHELTLRGIGIQRQVQLPIEYRGASLEAGFRLDLLVSSNIIVEVKAVEALLPIHQAQFDDLSSLVETSSWVLDELQCEDVQIWFTPRDRVSPQEN